MHAAYKILNEAILESTGEILIIEKMAITHACPNKAAGSISALVQHCPYSDAGAHNKCMKYPLGKLRVFRHSEIVSDAILDDLL